MSKFPELAATLAVALTLAAPVAAGNYGLGRPATDDEIAAWNVDVEPDGTGLPDGEGSVEDRCPFAAHAAIRCVTIIGRGRVGNALQPAVRLTQATKPTQVDGCRIDRRND